jgi:hypothetical protein
VSEFCRKSRGYGGDGTFYPTRGAASVHGFSRVTTVTKQRVVASIVGVAAHVDLHLRARRHRAPPDERDGGTRGRGGGGTCAAVMN